MATTPGGKRSRNDEEVKEPQGSGGGKRLAVVPGRHLYLLFDGLSLSHLPQYHHALSSSCCVRLGYSAEPGWSYDTSFKSSKDASFLYDMHMPLFISAPNSDAIITASLIEDHPLQFEAKLGAIEFKVGDVLAQLDNSNMAVLRGAFKTKVEHLETKQPVEEIVSYQATFHVEHWDPRFTVDPCGEEKSIDATEDWWTKGVVGAVRKQLEAFIIVDPAALPLPPAPSDIPMTKVIGMDVAVAQADPHLPMPPGAGELLTLLNYLPFNDEPGNFPSRKIGRAWMAKHTQNLWPDPKEGLWQDVTSDANFRQYVFCNAGAEFVTKHPDGYYYVDLDPLLAKWPTREKWERYGGKAFFDAAGNPTRIELPDENKQGVFVPSHPDWEYAKLRIRSGLFILASGMHLCKGHLRWANEPQIGTRRHLASNHPVNRLLAPHFFRSALVIAKSLSSLTPPRGMLHRSTAFTAESLAAFFQSAYDSFVFKPWYETAQDRGFDDTTNDSLYPAYRDAKDLNIIIRRYVEKYLTLYFNDQAIAADRQLQDYWQYMRSVWPTLPAGLTRQTLTDFCANVIFYNSAWHEQIGNVSGYSRDPAALALLIPKGTRPTMGLPQSNLLVAYITVMTQEKTPRLLGDWTHYFLDVPAKEVFRQFHQDLTQLATEIEARNAHREFPVRDYDPTYVKLSVSS